MAVAWQYCYASVRNVKKGPMERALCRPVRPYLSCKRSITALGEGINQLKSTITDLQRWVDRRLPRPSAMDPLHPFRICEMRMLRIVNGARLRSCSYSSRMQMSGKMQRTQGARSGPIASFATPLEIFLHRQPLAVTTCHHARAQCWRSTNLCFSLHGC